MKKQTALLLSFILLALTAPSAGPASVWENGFVFRGGRSGSGGPESGLQGGGDSFFTELAFSGEQLPYDRETSTFYLPLNPDDRGMGERSPDQSFAGGEAFI